MKYMATRWSSPIEWGIEAVPDDVPTGMFEDQPGGVFDTFTEAKNWAYDETLNWIRLFQRDLAKIRDLKKSTVHDMRPANVDLLRHQTREKK